MRKSPTRPYQPREPAVTSAMMAKVRNKDSRAEMILRRSVWKAGYRYRLHDSRLVGKPDLVFPRARLVVFVDSDWWHGRILLEEGEDALRTHLRTARQEWWVQKIRRTTDRDREVSASLRELGWRVLRVWESDILDDPEGAASKVIWAINTET